MTHGKLKDRNSYLFTSESVADGHPDKICDQISDAILDACLEIDSNARVAVETVIKDHDVFLLGEVSDGARPGDIDGVVKGVLRDIGHTDARWGLDLERLNITKKISGQAREISSAVDKDDGELGAGDQGMMYGYACQETPELMPMPIALAHALMRRQRELRFEDAGHVLGPDAKAQVTVQYQNDEPVGIHTVVLSTQHAEDITKSDLEELVREMIVNPVLADYGFDRPQTLYVNPSGSFCEGGPVADAGLTGRKIIVDTYGGYARHGGGAFSGKDATKVDRSGAYAARQLARSVVSSGLAGRCESRLAYAIGRPEPIELSLETWGSSDLSQEEILQEIMPEGLDAFRPLRIITRLGLNRPIFRSTASFGHFGRKEFPWESDL